MGEDRERENRYAEAAAFLGEVLERIEQGVATLEQCCAERPHISQELKDLYAACHRLHSSDDPTRPQEEEAFSSELMNRLAGRKGTFDRYHLRGEIAKGGQGTVLQVWDEDLRRALAMKVLLGKPAGGAAGSGASQIAPRALARFLEEAQVTGQLDHPGIVPIHELGLDGQGRVYFTMKLVKGRTLKEVYQLVADGQEGWTRTRALSVLLRVCEAMAYAHHKGVVHRDLKPANVMVGRFGEVFVMDWGLARVLGREDRANVRIAPDSATAELLSEREHARSEHASKLVTMDGHVVGTPAYMPPEQARGQLEEIGPHSDVYSVGAALYHLLAGHMPYVKPGMHPTNYAIWRSVQERAPDPLRERAPDAPAELVAICEKAMARQIEERYRDMGELAEDLRAFLEHRVVKTYQTGAVVELRKWIERNTGLAAASAAAVLALVAGLVTALVLKAKADDNAALAAHNAEVAKTNEEEARKQAEEARREKERAEASEKRAIESEHKEAQRADDVLRLSALYDLEDLSNDTDRLWPAHPEMVPQYEQWLRQAQELVDELPEHEAKLAELRTRATPASEPPSDGEGRGTAVPRRTRRDFASSRDRQWHNQLEKLVDGLIAFSAAETGLFSGISAEHGWGVRRRLEFARSIEELSMGGEASVRWAEAIESIRDSERCPSYEGLVITPQLGLIPIGQDPQSGFWEFAHVQTGEPAERGPDGKLILTKETGLVLVLVPGGTFLMGVQNSTPGGANFDPEVQLPSSPVRRVTLAPYFLSKYEMTQGQWLRTCGVNPSWYGPSVEVGGRRMDLTHPVEKVSWEDCQHVLARLGLVIPTEAQWECAARGGTSTIWWTGNEKSTLDGADNLADASFHQEPALSTWLYEKELDDGCIVHAPVGSYVPNPFGFHDVHGNIQEWCRELHSFPGKERPRDGERVLDEAASQDLDVPNWRALRGGNWQNIAVEGRIGGRWAASPDSRQMGCGVRPARDLSGP